MTSFRIALLLLIITREMQATIAERMQEKDEYNGFPVSKENEHSRLCAYIQFYVYASI